MGSTSVAPNTALLLGCSERWRAASFLRISPGDYAISGFDGLVGVFAALNCGVPPESSLAANIEAPLLLACIVAFWLSSFLRIASGDSAISGRGDLAGAFVLRARG